MVASHSTGREIVPVPTYRPLAYTPLGHWWLDGGKSTNTEAKRLVSELRDWAQSNDHPDAVKLDAALGDVERLFQSVWTVVDESLCQLRHAQLSPTAAAESIEKAMRMMHRWQDRNGRIGNASFVKEGAQSAPQNFPNQP